MSDNNGWHFLEYPAARPTWRILTELAWKIALKAMEYANVPCDAENSRGMSSALGHMQTFLSDTTPAEFPEGYWWYIESARNYARVAFFLSRGWGDTSAEHLLEEEERIGRLKDAMDQIAEIERENRPKIDEGTNG